MKIDEIKTMSSDSLREQLEENRQELFNLRFQVATRKTKNHQRIPIVKREIARIQTVLRERQLMEEYGGVDFSEIEQGAAAGSSGGGSMRQQSKRGPGLMGRLRRGR